MALPDLTGDVVLTGPQIGEFCDYLQRDGAPEQSFSIIRLRTSEKIERKGDVWTVTLQGNRGRVDVPIEGLS